MNKYIHIKGHMVLENEMIPLVAMQKDLSRNQDYLITKDGYCMTYAEVWNSYLKYNIEKYEKYVKETSSNLWTLGLLPLVLPIIVIPIIVFALL